MTPTPNVLSIPPPLQKTDVAASKSSKEREPFLWPIAAPVSPPARSFQQPNSPIDRMMRAAVASMTGGLSPAALTLAYWDWMAHLGLSPGKQMQLLGKAARQWMRLAMYAYQCATSKNDAPCSTPRLARMCCSDKLQRTLRPLGIRKSALRA